MYILNRLNNFCSKQIEKGNESSTLYFVNLYCEYIDEVLVPNTLSHQFLPYYEGMINLLYEMLQGFIYDLEHLEKLEEEVFETIISNSNPKALRFKNWDRHRKLDILKNDLG
jgi:hypothetical protein